MKKFTKIVFITLLFMLILLPLSAARTMSVTWNWVLNDPDVKEYRYQIDKEDADGWTVVGGKTSSCTLDGLDAYTSYTLYLQASYDGKTWSVSASNKVEAPLTKVEAESAAVEETASTVEAPTESVVVLPLVLENEFTVAGIKVNNRYSGSTFTSSTDPSLVLSDDILGFINYEVAKYDYLISAVVVDSITDGEMVLTVPEGLDFETYMAEYKNEIEAYLNSLTVVSTAVVEEKQDEKTETAVTEEVAIPQEEKAEVVKVEEAAPAAEETPAAPEVPEAPKTVEATPYRAESSESTLKPSFNLGFYLGAEWGFPSRTEFKSPVYSYLPRAGITLEGANLLHFSLFGFGVRSDISAVILPDGLSYSNILSFGKYTYDLTADLKLMGYINTKPLTVYFGGGLGYTLLSGSYGLAHEGAKLGSFNSSYAITAVLGLGFHLGEKIDLRVEGYSRYFFPSFSSFSLGALSISPSVALGIKF